MYLYLRFIKQRWALLGLGFACVFFGNFGQSFFISWFGADIQAELKLSATSYGSAYSLATLLSGTTLIFVGGLIDRIALTKFVYFIAGGMCLAACVMATSRSLIALFFGFYLIRLFGQGLFPHAGVTTMARCFVEDRGKAVSLALFAIPCGEIVLPTIAVSGIVYFGWEGVWWGIALMVPVLCVPILLFLFRNVKKLTHIDGELVQKGIFSFLDSEKETAVGRSGVRQIGSSSGRKALLTDKRFWLALPVLMTGPFVVTGIFIHQNYFLEQKMWSRELFASCFVVYGIVHGVSSIVSGLLVDRFSAAKMLPFYALPMAIALCLLALVDGNWVMFIVLSGIGISVGCNGPVASAIWAEVYGTEKLGSIRSLVASFSVWSTSIAPIALGVFIDSGKPVIVLAGGMAVTVWYVAYWLRFPIKGRGCDIPWRQMDAFILRKRFRLGFAC